MFRVNFESSYGNQFEKRIRLVSDCNMQMRLKCVLRWIPHLSSRQLVPAVQQHCWLEVMGDGEGDGGGGGSSGGGGGGHGGGYRGSCSIVDDAGFLR